MIDSNQSKTKMNDHTSYIYIYIYTLYILQESFTTCYHGYELLKRFSDIFSIIPCDQTINPCDLSTKSYLPGVST